MPGGATYIAGVDVGGTFTDALLLPLAGGEPAFAKLPSGADPATGVVAALTEAARRAGVAPTDVELVLNGTTIATNTVIEGSGARVGVLVTRGFRYVLEIARAWTPGPVSGWMVWDRPPPLADTRDVRELSGRIDAKGRVLAPIDDDEVSAMVAELAERGVEALTVALMNGYLRPDVEAHVGAIAGEAAPGLPISLASAVLPEFREYERTLAAVANAYVQPAMRRYVRRLEEQLRRHLPAARVSIVRSDGGVMSGADAGERPIETVFSGPAGGVGAAVFLGRLVGSPDVLSFDMGGTSTDIALSRDGHAAIARRSALTDYYKVRVPSLDVVAIGAGGGSIAHVPVTGALRVGPASAGASPGPACYGRGGSEPTVTDANVVLGYLPGLLGGRMELHRERADHAISRVAGPLGLSNAAAARAVVDVVNDRMLAGLRLVSVQRGHDPRDFTLVAFGGAGPLHANALLELLGSPLAVIPPAPGIFSTFGFLAADVRREFARSRVERLSLLERAELQDLLADLRTRAEAWLDEQGFPGDRRTLEWHFGMRYYRQGYELPVVAEEPDRNPHLLGELATGFVEAHRRTYGFELSMEPELVVVRCVATGHTPTPAVRELPDAHTPLASACVDSEHRIYWGSEWVQAPIYARERLLPGHVLGGPAVVTQEDATTLVHPDFRARVDRYGDLLLERA